jgi:hypothetical protein
MQSQIIVNQQVLETQSASLQNDFRGLADAQHETDETLNDVITGAAVGPVVGVPPVPPAIAAVLPVPPVATGNVQPQLHPLHRFWMMDGAKHFLRWQMNWYLHTKCVNVNSNKH